MIWHVLNGDALLEQLGSRISPCIVMRECLIEGPSSAEINDFFWNERQSYLSQAFPEVKMKYSNFVENEILKLTEATEDTEICLWFEYDLFCQLNMWFLISYIIHNSKFERISWVNPRHDSWSGFGRMSISELMNSFDQRIILSDSELKEFDLIWKAYANQNWLKIKSSTLNQNEKFPKFQVASEALLSIYPEVGTNRPERILRSILKEHPNENFGKIFQLFSKSAGEYGYGDLQVKHLLDRIRA